MTPTGPGLHPLQKLAGEVEADVGLEQDPADLPEPLLNRVFRQDTASSELLERVVQFLGELVEHKPVSITGRLALDKPAGCGRSPLGCDLPQAGVEDGRAGFGGASLSIPTRCSLRS